MNATSVSRQYQTPESGVSRLVPPDSPVPRRLTHCIKGQSMSAVLVTGANRGLGTRRRVSSPRTATASTSPVATWPRSSTPLTSSVVRTWTFTPRSSTSRRNRASTPPWTSSSATRSGSTSSSTMQVFCPRRATQRAVARQRRDVPDHLCHQRVRRGGSHRRLSCCCPSGAPRGRIVNVSSTMGSLAQPDSTPSRRTTAVVMPGQPDAPKTALNSVYGQPSRRSWPGQTGGPSPPSAPVGSRPISHRATVTWHRHRSTRQPGWWQRLQAAQQARRPAASPT